MSDKASGFRVPDKLLETSMLHFETGPFLRVPPHGLLSRNNVLDLDACLRLRKRELRLIEASSQAVHTL